MSRPPKPVSVIRGEGKSHRTKKELKMREEGEKSLISGVEIRETQSVKNNLVAHAEFERVVDLLERIEKNDAIYQSVINRYCLIYAECVEMEKRKETISSALVHLEESFEAASASVEGENVLKYITDFTEQLNKLNGAYVAIDKQLQTKRKMLLDMEKENVMTIASALRSIPKKEENKSNPLLEALNG